MRFLPWIVRALVLLVLLRFVLRLLFPPKRAQVRQPQRIPERQGGELVRDPNCGTYVPKAKAIAVGSGDSTQYFCSTKCRDEYSLAHAAS